MQITIKESVDSYLKGYNEFVEQLGSAETNGNIKPQRDKAIDDFAKLGFPTVRDEDWRFTNILPIVRSEFSLVKQQSAEDITIDLSGYVIPDLDHHLMVFIDGVYSEKYSSISGAAQGVVISPLSKALAEKNDLVQEFLFSCAGTDDQAFTALNTAYFVEGAFVYVPSDTSEKKTVHILNICTDNSPVMYNPRNLIVVGKGAKVKVIEHYVSLHEGMYLTNAVTEAIVEENGTLDHYLIELESKKAYNISSLEVKQGANSILNSHSVLLGGAIVRNNIHPLLGGQGCNSTINGLYLPADRQHIDNYMKVEHASPHCDSRQLYNGILADKSRGVFHGRIIVHEDAQKTDAKQTNRNLLLSDTAKIDTKPQLEIYADDVKCTHGATIGQLDKDAMFYLRSRGIEQNTAKTILLRAFASHNIETIKDEAVKNYVEGLVSDWFAVTGVVKELE